MSNTQHDVRILLTDGETFSDLSELPAEGEELVVLEIQRHEIESGNMARVLDSLHVMTDTVENVRRYRERLIFTVNGYEDDPRELPEIPEVRAYIKALVQAWPHWIWFQVRGMGAVALLFSLLCEVKVIRGKNGDYGTEFLSLSEVKRVALDLFKRGNVMLNAYDITDTEAQSSAESFELEFG
jgi:hypothetical protein